MLPILNENSDPLDLLASIIKSIEKESWEWDIFSIPDSFKLELRANIRRLQNLHKVLASQASCGKILIALRGDAGRPFGSVVVEAASVPLKVFFVDHRTDAVHRVDVVTVSKTATDQDFCEALHDAIAEYVSNPRALSQSDLKRIIEELK